MNDFIETIELLGQRREAAALEFMTALVLAQRLEVLELVERTQDLGCSFVDATRAMYENVVDKILDACRSESERTDAVVIMKITTERLINKYEDD